MATKTTKTKTKTKKKPVPKGGQRRIVRGRVGGRVSSQKASKARKTKCYTFRKQTTVARGRTRGGRSATQRQNYLRRRRKGCGKRKRA